MRCFELLRRTDLLPLTPQQYGEVGAIGLKHLARLKTHVRKKPPVHRPPRAPAPQAMNAQPGIDEVQEHVDQFGVDVPQEGEAGQPHEWQEEQHEQQADVPHHEQQAETPMPTEVRTHDPVDHPIFTPDHLQFSPSYLRHILSTPADTTSPEWDNLDVEGVGDPDTTFDDSQLVLNRRRVGQTSLGDQGGEGGGDITQLGSHVEPVVDPDGDVDAEGDTDMEDDDEAENEEVGGQDSGVGEVTQDATPPRPRRSKRPHPGAKPCGTDHSKEEKKKGGKKRKVKGG